MQKTILITGATDGIGLLTANKLVSKGHQVLLHGRNEAKLAEVAKHLGGASAYLADLSAGEAVEALADAVCENHPQIDVLINNAGILKTTNTKTRAGRDIRFEVNTLAPYRLTRRLLANMPKNGRVINLSSAAQAPVDISAMTSFQPMGDMAAYAQSKLAITVWSAEMARELPDGPVFVSINPGSLLATKMVKEGFGIEGSDVNVGADILVRAALSDAFADATGKYFDNDKAMFSEPHNAACDPEHAAEIMQALASCYAQKSG